MTAERSQERSVTVERSPERSMTVERSGERSMTAERSDDRWLTGDRSGESAVKVTADRCGVSAVSDRWADSIGKRSSKIEISSVTACCEAAVTSDR